MGMENIYGVFCFGGIIFWNCYVLIPYQYLCWDRIFIGKFDNKFYTGND